MPDYDVLIRHARLVDGTGNPWRHADVALAGDRVAAIAPPGRLEAAHAREVVDATGHVVAPGFIDLQSHAILPLMIDGRCLSKITQGVTTEVMGEAWTPAPMGGRNTEPLEGSLFEQRLDPVWFERAATWTPLRGLAAGDGGPRGVAERRLVPRGRHPAPVRTGPGHGPVERRRARAHEAGARRVDGGGRRAGSRTRSSTRPTRTPTPRS